MSAIPHEIPARLLDDPCRSIADCNQPGDELDLHAAARRVSMPLQCRCNVAATLCGPLGRIALGPLLISQCFFYYTGPSRYDPVAKTAAAQAAPLALVP